MRTIPSLSLAVVTMSVALCFAAASPASAAPGDVTHSVTTEGNTVTDTFVNNSSQLIECRYSALRAPFDPDGANDYAFTVGYSVRAGEVESYTTPSDTEYHKPGDRLFIEWACYTYDYSEAWGTGPVETLDNPTGVPYRPTAQPIVIVVGVGVVPETPTPTCTGSACLPTGIVGGS